MPLATGARPFANHAPPDAVGTGLSVPSRGSPHLCLLVIQCCHSRYRCHLRRPERSDCWCLAVPSLGSFCPHPFTSLLVPHCFTTLCASWLTSHIERLQWGDSACPGQRACNLPGNQRTRNHACTHIWCWQSPRSSLFRTVNDAIQIQWETRAIPCSSLMLTGPFHSNSSGQCPSGSLGTCKQCIAQRSATATGWVASGLDSAHISHSSPFSTLVLLLGTSTTQARGP